MSQLEPRPAPRAHHASHVAALALALCAVAFASAGCPAEPDPLQCPAGLEPRVVEGAARCMPSATPCSPNPCQEHEDCSVGPTGAAQCTARNLCLYAPPCPLGKACDPKTGQCSLDRDPCKGIVCGAGEKCAPATATCVPDVGPCDAICCNWDQVCDPANGNCVANRCLDANYVCKCGPTQACEPVTGSCLDVPGRCGTCTAEQYCDDLSGLCVTIQKGVPATGQVGAACGSKADCGRSGANAFCINDDGLFGDMPGGMCSAGCDDTPCPTGTGCVDVGMNICLDICRANDDCRPGYACLALTDGDTRRYCFPQGSGGSRCTGEGCRPVGAACTQHSDCVQGAVCQRYPGGYCMIVNCVGSNCDETKENCHCLSVGDCAGTTLSVQKCDIFKQDCRPGYACYQLSAASPVGYCYPRQCDVDLDCRTPGDRCDIEMCDSARGLCNDPCTSDAACAGGRRCDVATGHCYRECRSAADNCGPDGVCDPGARRCVRKCASDRNCGDGTYCDLVGGRCVPLCTADAQCGAGRVCGGDGRCASACSGDGDCGTNSFCDAGHCRLRCARASDCGWGSVCDTGSGRCLRDLATVTVGAACAVDRDCGLYNGTCLAQGFPGGYCTATGCSASVPCAAGSVCTADGSGGARCLKSCDPGAADACREGYGCRQQGQAQVCVPQGS